MDLYMFTSVCKAITCLGWRNERCSKFRPWMFVKGYQCCAVPYWTVRTAASRFGDVHLMCPVETMGKNVFRELHITGLVLKMETNMEFFKCKKTFLLNFLSMLLRRWWILECVPCKFVERNNL